jgi:hypothetical protein
MMYSQNSRQEGWKIYGKVPFDMALAWLQSKEVSCYLVLSFVYERNLNSHMEIFCLECPSILLTATMKWAYALWASPLVYSEPRIALIAAAWPVSKCHMLHKLKQQVLMYIKVWVSEFASRENIFRKNTENNQISLLQLYFYSSVTSHVGIWGYRGIAHRS